MEFKKCALERLQPVMLELTPLEALLEVMHLHKRPHLDQHHTEATQPVRKLQLHNLPRKFKLRVVLPPEAMLARKTKINNCQVGALQVQERSLP